MNAAASTYSTMRPTYLLVSNVILCLLLSACGGGSGGGSSGSYAMLAALAASGGGTSGAGSSSGSGAGSGSNSSSVKALIAVSAEAPGAHCASGGTQIDAGWDSDNNGVLAASEVGSTQYVCNGAAGATGRPGAAGPAGPAGEPGSNGLNMLVQMRDEPAGAGQCAAGGKAIDVGLDRNANGTLDAPGEILSTGYVCNGARGAAGAAGAAGQPGATGETGAPGERGVPGQSGPAGLSALMRISDEGAGANCTYGGKKVETGMDSNPPNGLLDASEITATNYVCNGATVNWINVTGPAVQAQANRGYVAGNDATQVVVTLPSNPAVGSVVRVSGAGMGGWRIAQNAGQAISSKNLGGAGIA